MKFFARLFFSLALLFSIIFSQTPLSFARVGLTAGEISVIAHEDPATPPPLRSWLMYSARPGDTLVDSVDVTNTSKDPKNSKVISVNAVDAGLTTNNGFRIKESNDVQKYIGKWTTLEKNEVTLLGGKDTVVGFTLKIPKDAEEGEYWGGIAVQEKIDPKATGLTTSYRVGVRFFLKLDKKLAGVSKRGARDYPDFNIRTTIGVRDEIHPEKPAAPASSVAPSSEPSPLPAVPSAPSIPEHVTAQIPLPPAPPTVAPLVTHDAPPSASAISDTFGTKLVWIGIPLLVLFFISFVMFTKKKGPKRLRKKVLVIALGFLFALGAAKVHAEGIGITPNPEEGGKLTNRSWLVYDEVEPGKIINDSVRIINLFNEPVTAVVEGVDGETTKQGGFALRSGDSEKKEIGLWIKLGSREVELQPQESKIIPFTLTVPSSAQIGDHIGGIVVYRKNKKMLAEGATGFEIQARVGTRVYLTVKGEKKLALNIGDIRTESSDGKYTFYWKFENTGNVRIQPQMSIHAVSRFGGRNVDLQAPLIAELNPGVSSEVPIVWENPPQGWYKLLFTVAYGDQKRSQEIGLFNVNTTTTVLFGGVAFVILLLLVLIFRSFRKPSNV